MLDEESILHYDGISPIFQETVDLFKFGETLESAGRHCKRLAICFEYKSGRNMEEWYRLLEINSGTARNLLSEARGLGMLSPTDDKQAKHLSFALQTKRAAIAYSSLPQELKNEIIQQLMKNPQLKIKESDINLLQAHLEPLWVDHLIGTDILRINLISDPTSH